MTPRALPLVLLLLTIGVPAPVLAQAGDDAFKEGLDARKNGNWPAAAAAMRRAIQADPQESQRKLDRTLFFGGTEYLPHFFLGEALFRQGDCAGAMVPWGVSDRQGVIHRVREYAEDLRNGMTACELKGVLPPGKFEPAMTRARQQVNDALALANKVRDRGLEHLDVWRGQAGFDDRYAEAARDIEQARTKLQAAATSRLDGDIREVAGAAERAHSGLTSLSTEFEAAVARRRAVRSLADEVQQMVSAAETLGRQIDDKREWLTPTLVASRNDATKALSAARSHLAARAPSEADLRAARGSVADATKVLQQVLDEVAQIEARVASQRFGRAYAPVSEAFAAIENQFATLESLMASRPTKVTPELPAQRDEARKTFDAARRRLESARRAEQTSGLADASATAERLQAELQTLIATFGPVSLEERGVPGWLQEGASLFFQGEYARTLAVLDPSTGQAPPVAQLHVHLFRAAARYALYMRSGENDDEHRAQALAEIARCKAIDPLFEPDPRAFSPRFVEFYAAAPP